MHQRTGPESDSTETVSIRSQQIASYRDAGEVRAMRFAMRISLAFGVVMLVGKMAAYFMTGSAAIMSDAAESVIHVVAVAFAEMWIWLILSMLVIVAPPGIPAPVTLHPT